MKIASYSVSKEIIISAPVPSETRTYKPVSHQQLIDLTLNSIDEAGFTLDKELYSSARDGRIANGRYTISDVADDEMQLQIGWQNSYDKSVTLKFAIGTSIFICQNGCVSGSYGSFKKKHTGEIKEFTPSAIKDYIQSAKLVFKVMQAERNLMKTAILTVKERAEMIGRLFVEKEILTSVQLNTLLAQLKVPSYDYKAPDSIWELYNHVTYAMKQTHPAFWIDGHKDVHDFFMTETHLRTPETVAVVPATLV